MRQFAVYRNFDAASARFAPYLVLLSTHLLTFEAVIVAPLLKGRIAVAEELELSVSFGAEMFVLSLTGLLAVDPHRLRRKVGDLAEHEHAIRRGLDRLFTGF